MVVGIRGTCGWLKVNDRWSTEICVLEGTVQCNVTDPVTGQVKTASVQGGEKAVATVYPQDQEGDKCDIIQERFEPGDINGFVLEELAKDPGLCGDIYEASGLDILGALETARERLEQDQREMQETLDRIGDQQAEQDSNVSTGPVWEQEGSDSSAPPSGSDRDDRDDSGDRNDSGGVTDRPPAEEQPPAGDNTGGGNGDATDPPADPAQGTITLTMPTLEDMRKALEDDGVKEIILSAGDDPDGIIMVPREEKLTLPDGIGVTVQRGVFLIVAGGMIGGNNNTLTIQDGGAVEVSSFGILKMQFIENQGFLENEKEGKIETGKLITDDTFSSAGDIDGTVTSNGGDVEITGGTINGGSNSAVVINGGTFTMAGGEIVSSSAATVDYGAGAKLELTGGTITNSGEGYALYAADLNNVSFEGTIFRSREKKFITNNTGPWDPPTGYTEQGPDEDDYYYLIKQP